MAVTFFFDPRFPFQDVVRIAGVIEEAGIWIPGYEPPEVGPLHIGHIRYMQDVEGYEIVALLDRNLIGRLAKVAHEGAPPLPERDKPTDLAVKVMAFCQCLDIGIEPSISLHELAQHHGNARTWEELGWFRVADRGGKAHEWIEMESGLRDRPSDVGRAPEPELDLAKPLARWRRNYMAMLKVAELELRPDLTPFERAIRLVDWMAEDYCMAGPAAMTAMVCFAPRRPGGLLKRLKSPDRERALDGIRNAAWDATYLSEFVRRVKREEEDRRRHVLVTADKALASIGPALWPAPEDEAQLPDAMTRVLEKWWPEREGAALAHHLSGRILAAQDREPPNATKSVDDPIGRLIEEGEQTIRGWHPS